VEPAAPREALLREYLDVLRRNAWVVAAATILVPVVALALSAAQPLRYSATARVLLNTQALASSTLDTTSPTPASPVPPERVAQTQAELARVTAVVDRVLRRVRGEGLTAEQFLSWSSVSSDANADLLSFTVIAPTRDAAKVLATAYATAFTRYRQALDTGPVKKARAGVETLLTQLEAEGNTGSPLYRSLQTKDQTLQSLELLRTSNAAVVQRALTSTQVQPKLVRNVAIGLALGLLLGIALAFLRQALDGRVVTASHVSSVLGLPLLGRLSGAPKTVRRRDALVTVAEPNSRLSQAYRVLRATIESMIPRTGRVPCDCGDQRHVRGGPNDYRGEPRRGVRASGAPRRPHQRRHAQGQRRSADVPRRLVWTRSPGWPSRRPPPPGGRGSNARLPRRDGTDGCGGRGR
jgi:capsular polysaccharide biosynthesis protein